MDRVDVRFCRQSSHMLLLKMKSSDQINIFGEKVNYFNLDRLSMNKKYQYDAPFTPSREPAKRSKGGGELGRDYVISCRFED